MAGGMHGWGGCVAGWGVCMAGGARPAGETATAAGGTHPTGMHSYVLQIGLIHPNRH